MQARMTKCADNLMEKVASEFIVDTCQLLPNRNLSVLDCVHDPAVSEYHTPMRYNVPSGSSAEFYIRPLLPCVADIDALLGHNNQIAFIEDFPVLPNDVSGLHDTIDCFKIEPCFGYPGFVQLRLLGKMRYNWKYKKFEFNQAHLQNIYFRINFHDLVRSEPEVVHIDFTNVSTIVAGPAVKSQHVSDPLKYDVVQCVWSPQWPREAQDWPARPRRNGWPTTTTISEVLQNGCHVVCVQHRVCRNVVGQWRLSFSVAEVILLQSWTKVQQVVYHMLRFLAKRELIQKNCQKEDEVLCNYHLKTLMLWACEEMPPEWWNSYAVFSICCELLHKLSHWLKKRNCPNFFIPEANLFHEPTNPAVTDKTEAQLNAFCNSEILCHWFMDNYTQPAAAEYDIIERRTDFTFCKSVLFNCWKAQKLVALDMLFSMRFAICNFQARFTIKSGFSTGLRPLSSAGLFARELVLLNNITNRTMPTTHKVLYLSYQDSTLHILHITHCLVFGEMSWDSTQFVESVKDNLIQHKFLKSRHHNFPKSFTVERSQLQYLRAHDLMENLSGSNSRSEFQLLSILSKEFLRKALECEDSNSDRIAPAALVYLAALHFATSEYKTVIELCSVVLINQTPEEENETLNAGCLFFIDDVLRIVGFHLLYLRIKNNERFSGRQCYLDLRLTPQVFAHYLAVISHERLCRKWILNKMLPTPAFSFDQFLLVLIKRKCFTSMNTRVSITDARQFVIRRPQSLTKYQTLNMSYFRIREELIEVLMEYGLELITSFYSVIRTDFGIPCSTVDCYRALHLYKCRQYAEVLHMCERILNEPDLQSNLQGLAFANVLLLPPFDSYFDGYIQSLLGFHTLFFYFSPVNDKMSTFQLNYDSTFEHHFAHVIYQNKDVLSGFLKCPYSVRCQYFLGRHFLARYLKLRCIIDCNHPDTERMASLASMRSNLPFEHIIRGFLLKKFVQFR